MITLNIEHGPIVTIGVFGSSGYGQTNTEPEVSIKIAPRGQYSNQNDPLISPEHAMSIGRAIVGAARVALRKMPPKTTTPEVKP